MTEPATFSFTEATNALDYLEEARHFIERAPSQPSAWKWVTIALHGALYGFAIVACRGSTNDFVVKMQKERQGASREYLISIGAALKRCQDPAVMGRQTIGKPLVLTRDQAKSLKSLTQIFRNRFEHHIPGDWTFFVDDFPPMCRDVLEVIRFLVRSSGSLILWRPGQGERFDQLVAESLALLK